MTFSNMAAELLVPRIPPPEIVAGIDPSLTATGISVLEWPASGMRLRFVRTIRTEPSSPLADRLWAIRLGILAALDEAHLRDRGRTLEVAMETPVDFRVPKSGPSQMMLFGAAIGAAMLAAREFAARTDVPVHFYELKNWLPRVRRGGRGGWTHSEPHAQVVARHRALVTGLAEGTDDEVMAAALALHHFAVRRSGR
jgi:Holliday junction resolvasome RuvABC endonuclease subunit